MGDEWVRILVVKAALLAVQQTTVTNHPFYLVSLPLDCECEDSQTGLRQHRFVLEVRLHGGNHQAAHALGTELGDVGELWGWVGWGGVGYVGCVGVVG